MSPFAGVRRGEPACFGTVAVSGPVRVIGRPLSPSHSGARTKGTHTGSPDAAPPRPLAAATG